MLLLPDDDDPIELPDSALFEDAKSMPKNTDNTSSGSVYYDSNTSDQSEQDH